jgi:hypothetical protein
VPTTERGNVARTKSAFLGEVALDFAAANGGTPDIDDVRNPEQVKYGFGLNAPRRFLNADRGPVIVESLRMHIEF